MVFLKITFRAPLRKMSADREAQSQSHKKVENGGVVVRGTGR